MCVLELAKLFQKRENTQKQNLHTLLDSLEPNQYGITESEIENWKKELDSLDKIITKKINVLKDKLFAHLDDDYLEKVKEFPLSFHEIKSLLDTAIKIVREINEKIGESGNMVVAELEFIGSPTELESGAKFLQKYKELLEIEKKYSS